MITTTLNKIRAANPCPDGWRELLTFLGKTESDDEPLAFATILESNGIDDALWATRTAPEHAKEWRLYAVWAARQVQHLLTDNRSIAALDVAERHAHGQATDDELAAAWDAAWDARAAAGAAAGAAARAAARAAAGDAAWAAAGAATWAAARAAARDTQAIEFLRVVSKPCAPTPAP